MYFAENLFVEFAGSQIDPATVNRLSETSIFVNSIPSADSLGIQFDTTVCTATGNVPGARLADTAVSVAVINLPGICRDELAGTLVYSPPPPNDCEPTPPLLVTEPFEDGETITFAGTAPGGCSPTVNLTVRNEGGENAAIATVLVSDPIQFAGSTTCNSASVPYLGTCSITIQFCPDILASGAVLGTLSIPYAGSASSDSVDISLVGPTSTP
jgi:hypothetical protein